MATASIHADFALRSLHDDIEREIGAAKRAECRRVFKQIRKWMKKRMVDPALVSAMDSLYNELMNNPSEDSDDA